MGGTGGRPRHARAADYERLDRTQRLRRFAVGAGVVVAGGVGVMATTALASDAARIGGALVRIESAGCGWAGTAKGLAIDDRHVVTSWRVVHLDATPSLVTPDGTTLEARVIGGSEVADVAVLQVDGPLPGALQPVDVADLAAAGAVEAIVQAAPSTPAVECVEDEPTPAADPVDHSVVPTIATLPTDR